MAFGLGLLLNTLISSLVPVGVEAAKKVIDTKIGTPPPQPASVDEQVKLVEAETNRLKAVAGLDQPGGNPSQWVVDLRASARYVASGLVILGGGLLLAFAGLEAGVALMVVDAISIVFGFLFGSRFVVPRVFGK